MSECGTDATNPDDDHSSGCHTYPDATPPDKYCNVVLVAKC